MAMRVIAISNQNIVVLWQTNLVELPAIGINLNGRQTFDMQVQAWHQCLTCLCERFPKLANAVSAEKKYCSNDLIAGFPVCPLFVARDLKKRSAYVKAM